MKPLLFALASVVLLQADDIVLPDGKAKTLVENTCSECHGLDQVVNNAMSADEWRSTVNRMVKKGATLSPAEIDTVVEYLSVYFAPEKVNVNTATVKELQNGLGLTPAEANALVAYRTKNGRIQDLSALAKVDGVDTKKISAKKDLIAF